MKYTWELVLLGAILWQLIRWLVAAIYAEYFRQPETIEPKIEMVEAELIDEDLIQFETMKYENELLKQKLKIQSMAIEKVSEKWAMKSLEDGGGCPFCNHFLMSFRGQEYRDPERYINDVNRYRCNLEDDFRHLSESFLHLQNMYEEAIGDLPD